MFGQWVTADPAASGPVFGATAPILTSAALVGPTPNRPAAIESAAIPSIVRCNMFILPGTY
jgi:hypothetical protein